MTLEIVRQILTQHLIKEVVVIFHPVVEVTKKVTKVEGVDGAIPQFIEWTVPQPNTSPTGHFPTEQLIDHGQFIDQKCLQ
uniref:Uncharacterized protein n=1 Tax=Acrobeloides nanus TaxID=290746 RepID=A0A914EIS1_9BILA